MFVAAGGGGDAVAAAMLDAGLYGGESPATVFTFAWDRLLPDAAPGPRGPEDFTGLRPLTPSVWTVPAEAVPIAPASSTLPGLAAELPHSLALIDPHHGAEGIVRQLEELIRHLDPDSVDLLDVGGDILAQGSESTLRSPLADALTLAACCELNFPVRLLVAGPGLDGELPAEALRDRLGPVALTLTAEHVEPVGSALEWHPSEAAALLAATARGARGLCEVRGDGLPVPLTDEGAAVYEADLEEALDRNELAGAILATENLSEVEQYSRDICGFSEIDQERGAAGRPAGRSVQELDPEVVLRQLDAFESDARARGITHTTFPRLAEAFGLGGKHDPGLKGMLLGRRPERYASPIWRVAPGV
ncbi:DUF1152 domain-containing protein [Streptomyces sp. Pv4-95]|uniref:DUF1152 domain-containing protein n=1 Tax=Streptomyces sp. Pv4-95 TaxID=3049543 RepID=UPI003891B29C